MLFGISQRRCLFIILGFDCRFFLGADRLDIFLDLFQIRRPSHRVDARTSARFVHDIDGLIRQETAGNISIGKSNGCFQRLVGKPGFCADLYEADLSQADLDGADLREADLRGTNLRGAKLRDARRNEVNLIRANLIQADLIRADMGVTQLRWAKLGGTQLSEANLSRANLSRAARCLWKRSRRCIDSYN
jgi:pentapeptide repeat protein